MTEVKSLYKPNCMMTTIQGVDPKMIANNLEPAFPTHPGDFERRNRIQRDFAV